MSNRQSKKKAIPLRLPTYLVIRHAFLIPRIGPLCLSWTFSSERHLTDVEHVEKFTGYQPMPLTVGIHKVKNQQKPKHYSPLRDNNILCTKYLETAGLR